MGVTGINKILFGGDKKTAKEFTGQANSQMNILIQEMSFQNLKQGFRKVQLYKNVWIECRKIFEYQECKIYVTPSTELVTCWFNDYFMEGIIVARQHDTDATMEHSVVYVPGANPPDTEEYHIIKKSFSSGYDRDGNRTLYEEWDLRIDKPSSAVLAENEIVWEDGIYPYKITPVIPAVNLYTVEVCMNGVLEIIENVCGNNLAIYSVGQPVMVAKYNKEEPTYANVPKGIEDPEYIITPFVLNRGTDVQFRWSDYALDTENEWHDKVIYSDNYIGTGGIRLHENEDYNDFVVQPGETFITDGVQSLSSSLDERMLKITRFIDLGDGDSEIETTYERIPVYLHGDKDYYQYISRGAAIPASVLASERLSGGGNAEIQAYRRGSYHYGTFFEECILPLPGGESCDYPYYIGTVVGSDCRNLCVLTEPSVSAGYGLIAYNDSHPERSSIFTWLDASGKPIYSSTGNTNILFIQNGDSEDDEKTYCAWNLDTDTEAQLLNYSGTGYIVFPCSKSEIQHWLTASTRRFKSEFHTILDLYPRQLNLYPVPDYIGDYHWFSCSDSNQSDPWSAIDYPGIDPQWLVPVDDETINSSGGALDRVIEYEVETDGLGQCTPSSYHYKATGNGVDGDGYLKTRLVFSASGDNISIGFTPNTVDMLRPRRFDGTPVTMFLIGENICLIGVSGPLRIVGQDPDTGIWIGMDITHSIETNATGDYHWSPTGKHLDAWTVSSSLDWEYSIGELAGYSEINNINPSATVSESGALSATETSPPDELSSTTAPYSFNYYGAVSSESGGYSITPEQQHTVNIMVCDSRHRYDDGGVTKIDVSNLMLKATRMNTDGLTPIDRVFSPYPELEAYIKDKVVLSKTYVLGEDIPEIRLAMVSLPHSIPLAVNF